MLTNDDIVAFHTIMAENLPQVIITYKQGLVTKTNITALISNQIFEKIDDENVLTRTMTTDFVVKAADINLTPKRNDVITYSGSNYEVTEPVYDTCDPYRFIFRIHTKKIS